MIVPENLAQIRLVYFRHQSNSVTTSSLQGFVNEKKHTGKHTSHYQALTYQMLLPCGVLISATLYVMDIAEIWSNELSERFIMMVMKRSQQLKLVFV